MRFKACCVGVTAGVLGVVFSLATLFWLVFLDLARYFFKFFVAVGLLATAVLACAAGVLMSIVSNQFSTNGIFLPLPAGLTIPSGEVVAVAVFLRFSFSLCQWQHRSCRFTRLRSPASARCWESPFGG